MHMMTGLSLAMAMLASTAPSATELTIYNQGFALVKEVRTIDLRAGIQSVAIEDVAQRIEPSSVAIRSLNDPGSFTVLEQNYQYDLISPQAILNKAVGRRIVLNRVLPDGARERIEGTLLSAPQAVVTGPGGQSLTFSGLVMRTADGRILLDPTGEIEVAEIPEGLISRPTLLWELEARRPGPNTVELSYLTQGMSWQANYVLLLDGAGEGDLKGWVTLNNQSGATWKDARLKLLAGDVQRVAPRAPGLAAGRAEAADAAARGFEQEAFADYHLYTLGRPTTVRNNESKQISLLEGFGVPVRRRLVVDAMRMFRGFRPGEGEVGTGVIKPQIRIEFTNDQRSNLGMPLPRGTVKVFQRDARGSVQMLGEDEIDHTPKDEKLSLVVGRAFDVVAERKRVRFEWIGSGDRRRGMRETFEIELRNRKETPETVVVLERHWGQYRVLDKSMDLRQLDAETLEFTVELEAGETRTIRYTVETTW
jgi:hypothetical protein